MLQTYSQFRPTSLDARGLGLEDQQDWLVAPVVRTPNLDEDPLTVANWRAILEAIEELEGDHDVHYFGHWATPFEVILVEPNTPAAEWLEKCADALEDYPVVCEHTLCVVEDEMAERAWRQLDNEERRALLREAGLSQAKYRCVFPPSDDQGRIQQRLLGR